MGQRRVPDVAKLHHTVPQFYLRGFANDAERITTVRLPGEKRYTSRIRNTAATNNFYSIDGHPDGADAFEQALSQLEGDAASIFKAIVDGEWPLSEEQRTTLATFMAMQHLRGPDHRRTMEYLAAQMTKLELQVTGRDNVKEWVQKRYKIDVDDDEADMLWQQATRPGGPPITIAPIAHIEQMVHSAFELLPYIVGRPWTLVRFRRRSLMTCDSPVALMPDPDDEPWRGVGFSTALAITFPLTRRLGLLMGDIRPLAEAKIPVERVRAGEGDGVESGTTALAKLFTDTTVNSASEYLYHHPDDDRVVPSPLPEPRLSNLSAPSLDQPEADHDEA